VALGSLADVDLAESSIALSGVAAATAMQFTKQGWLVGSAAALATGTRPRRLCRDFGGGNVPGIPVPIVWTIVVRACAIAFLHFATFGRRICTADGNATPPRYQQTALRRGL
jgi:ribose/xylose/arabinose/galactoside ABC-type transport system permease subunit